MAFRTQKISQMTPKGANLEATDLIEVSTIESGSYVTRSITGQEIIDAAVGNVDWGDIGGTLSAQTDLQNALDAKVPTSRTLTINGVTQDLSANRTFTISTGITIGSTAIASGTVGRVLFQGTGNVVQQSSSLFWDATNNRLGIGTATPNSALEVVDTGAASFVAPARFLVPNNNVSGRVSQFYLGTSMTTLNSISWNFHYQGNGSTANYQSFGFNGVVNPALAMFGTLNVGIGTTTDAGFRLDVNGTARVQGNTSVSLNQNAQTKATISNTTSGTSSRVDFILTSDGGAGEANLGKFSSTTTAYKILAARDSFLYNNPTAGDIAILNDFSSGRIKFTAGGASTAQMTLFSTGNVGINTTTDAGFRLDVNGTARVSGAGNTSSTTAFTVRNSSATNLLTIRDDGQLTSSGTNSNIYSNFTTGNKAPLLFSHDGYGTATPNDTRIDFGYRGRQTGGLNSYDYFTYKVFQGSPDTNVITGFEFYTHQNQGASLASQLAMSIRGNNIIFANLPTSSAGLPTGAIWNDAGTLKIV